MRGHAGAFGWVVRGLCGGRKPLPLSFVAVAADRTAYRSPRIEPLSFRSLIRQALQKGAAVVVRTESASEVLARAIERVSEGDSWLDPTFLSALLADRGLERGARGRSRGGPDRIVEQAPGPKQK